MRKLTPTPPSSSSIALLFLSAAWLFNPSWAGPAPAAAAAGAGAGAGGTLEARVDAAVNAIVARTGVPSASIALVRDSHVVYAQAYGFAQLTPRRLATPTMRYPVGSISKEFTATALLLLQESHALSLDDPAGHWVSGLGPAAAVSLRALLSHTSGVRDFWPQDYPTPDMFEPIDPQRIVARWAAQPLDFPPGTAWQYSNTGYVIAGLAAEKAAGKPLFDYLASTVFEPLAMHSVIDVDSHALPDDDAVGYRRFALGPPRPAPASGMGWLFAAGELAMTPSDLARWDIALIEHRILQPASLHELGTEVRLENGAGTNYGLGLFVNLKAGHRVLSHGGEIDGFTAENRIYPDDGAAIVVLTNEDATDASATIADALAEILLTVESDADARVAADARAVLRELQSGTLNRSRFTANGNSYFTDEALADFKSSLSALGEPTSFTLTRSGQRGGFGFHVYDVGFAHQRLRVVVRGTADGRFEQFTVSAE